MKMRKVVLDENIIPPITHPWGRVWIQPNPKDIILDDEYAAMKQKDFDLLADYTASEPTGKYNGKMWKGEFDTASGITLSYEDRTTSDTQETRKEKQV